MRIVSLIENNLIFPNVNTSFFKNCLAGQFEKSTRQQSYLLTLRFKKIKRMGNTKVERIGADISCFVDPDFASTATAGPATQPA